MPDSAFSSVQELTLFASHDSYGVVDLGATKTVIGSDNIPSLLQSIHPEVRKKLQRCKCQVTFRFGNHGTLQSQHALVVPFQGFKLKIAVVPGSTPFLLSNTLLRAIEAVIDTQKQTLWSQKLQRLIPLHITNKGLFLMDLNDLVQPIGHETTLPSEPAETHLSVESSKLETSVCATTAESKHVIEKSTNLHEIEKNKEWKKEDNEIDTKNKTQKTNMDSSNSNLSRTLNSLEGSKNFAQSFQFPDRVNHVQPCSSLEECSGCGQRTTPGFLQDVNARAGGLQDRFRNQTCWRQLPQRMEPGSTLGHVADSALRKLQETVSHEVPEIRRDEDREGRARGHHGSSDGPSLDKPTGSLTPLATGKPSVSKAKAKVQPKMPPMTTAELLEEIDEFEEDTFEMLNPLETEKDAEIQCLQNRMLNIENALQQVICHLGAQQPTQEQ